MLQLKGFKKHFGGTLVIEVPELDLEPASYWLQGENGAGKTTFLKSLAGLLSYAGTICMNGADLRLNRRNYLSRVNYGEAELVYPAFLTGQDLLHFYLQTKGGSEEQMRHMARELRMDRHLNQKTGTYSSGMAKKLSLLLSFTGDPSLILLDEPFITLDKEAVLYIKQLLEEKQAAGVSLLVSSHQAAEMPVSSAVLRIRNKTLEPAAYV